VRLLTVGSLPPEWGGPVRGGAATFHAALLTGLLERHGEVDVVGVLPPGPLDREIPAPVWVRPDDVGRASFYRGLLDRLRPDVVLMNHIAHTVGVTHARLESPPPAVGVIQSWHNVTFRSGDERRRAVALTREALGGLGAMVAVSRHTMEEGRRLGFEYPVVTGTIHNAVPPLYMGEDVDPDGEERAGVLFLGSLIPRKAPGALVEAAGMLPGLAASLVGRGELERELRAQVDALGLSGRVRIADPPAGDGHLRWVRRELLRSEVMCLPSSSEGLPLAFVESLACGTPIVGFAPAVHEIRETIGIDVGEPLDSSAPEEVATAIERVLAGEWDRPQLRRATLDAFGLPKVVDRYVELLSGVASGATACARNGVALRSGPGKSSAGGTAVCVLGMSRTGTSLTTRILGLAGVDLGPEEELLGADRRQLADAGEGVMAKARGSNPEGHWEHYRLMRLNERILRTMGGSWRDPPSLPSGWENAAELDDLREEARAVLTESFAGRALWGWKDPRSSLTLPFWQRLVGGEMRYVICLRGPAEVAASLGRRDGIEPEHAAELWLRYLAAALVNTSGRRRLVVPYESFFREPAAAADRLARFVGHEGAFAGPDGEAMLAETIDERLWRNRGFAGAARPEPASPSAASLFRVAELLAMLDPEDVRSDRAVQLNAAADLCATGALERLDGYR
jgi:glycosyltransferase involved in cell wall biosynthesis